MNKSLWIPIADLFVSIVGIFLVIAALLIMQMKVQQEENKSPPVESVGALMVNIFWKENNEDIDLWVLGPGDRPVGYSYKSGKVFSLLWDDVGHPSDKVSERHYENAVARNAVPGRYVVNLHWYRNGERLKSIPIDIEAFVLIENRRIPIINTTVELTKEGQELTIIQFKLDKENPIIPGSINEIQFPLREEPH